MTNKHPQQNHKPKQAAPTRANQHALEVFHRRLDELQRFLWQYLPCVPFSNRSRHDQQRVVLGWDGLRIALTKPCDLPPPRAADLHAAIDGFIDDIQVTLTRAGMPPTSDEAANVLGKSGGE